MYRKESQRNSGQILLQEILSIKNTYCWLSFMFQVDQCPSQLNGKYFRVVKSFLSNFHFIFNYVKIAESLISTKRFFSLHYLYWKLTNPFLQLLKSSGWWLKNNFDVFMYLFLYITLQRDNLVTTLWTGGLGKGGLWNGEGNEGRAYQIVCFVCIN